MFGIFTERAYYYNKIIFLIHDYPNIADSSLLFQQDVAPSYFRYPVRKQFSGLE